MVYGRYNELVNGVYKPTCNWGASHCSNLSIRKCHLPTTNSSVSRPWWLMHQSHSTDFTGSTPLESMFASTLWQPITKHGNIIFRIHTWCCFFKVSIYSACSYDFPIFTHMFPMFVPYQPPFSMGTSKPSARPGASTTMVMAVNMATMPAALAKTSSPAASFKAWMHPWLFPESLEILHQQKHNDLASMSSCLVHL